jgi:hypothetical protein
MTIDPRQNLVIIKGKDHTESIFRVTQEAERTAVTYKSGKSYRYARSNVEWLSKPDHGTAPPCGIVKDIGRMREFVGHNT